MICSVAVCDVAFVPDALDSPAERLAWARSRAGYADAASFARAVALKDVTYRAYEAGQNGFTRHAALFARELGVSVGWLLEGGPLPSPQAREPDQPPSRDASAGETVSIIQLDLSLPMGPGATVEDYIEEEPRIFDLAYIRGFTRTPAHRLRLARGIGDSMYPTLQGSDQVWIDSTQRQLNQSDRIWAVSINGGAAIKRLRPMKGGRVLVISDNATVDNYEVGHDELLIGGRVIRLARDV